MTRLENLLNVRTLKKICIKKVIDGKLIVKRMTFNKAYPLLQEGWEFAGKSEYKAIEVNEENKIEAKVKKVKTKAKDRKKNEKN